MTTTFIEQSILPRAVHRGNGIPVGSGMLKKDHQIVPGNNTGRNEFVEGSHGTVHKQKKVSKIEESSKVIMECIRQRKSRRREREAKPRNEQIRHRSAGNTTTDAPAGKGRSGTQKLPRRHTVTIITDTTRQDRKDRPST